MKYCPPLESAAAKPAVLIVEDEVLVGMALSVALSIAGNHVIGPVSSLSRALELAAKECPEVALVDVNLHGKPEGIDVAQALARQYGTTIVFVTALPELTRPARHAALGVVSKPYEIALMPRVVAAALRHRHGEPLGTVPRWFELFC